MPRLVQAASAASFAVLLLMGGFASGPAMAQSVSFGSRTDTKSPVEVNADTLTVDQKSGQATFSGNVIVAQGEMRLTSDRVTVIYDQGDKRKIQAMQARGNVTLVNGPDAAEAAAADYTVGSGKISLTGNVLLTQGQSVIAGEKVDVDLATGAANVSGRVRTVLTPGAK